ncbi:hypothetical protein METBIDRAFT_45678 [Metschnikowia bicuspidata var. bicuspidata NRRL YB-4993]|uniref:FAR-17a/AIG1-like protein n=1 Tax=Metschnikowia bicuspidata var. bicuspidata NRRL YB-4993 TaxID=869754 RepID=A0A1A0H6K3_9ASCO|nr:hypothetical protein METBIDRAFT_45678 [Metschnikowia bicuspidata var. bicuspidata NRRL YB-4993]OBA19590.1 hypothetical protein METBIDRAFT_45678 [Metschnikowia bicuspidata var. bicuspidata NRRL YB-4993]
MARTAGDFRAIGLNLAAVASGIYAVHYISTYVELPPHLAGAGHWQFLTNISLLLSQIVFALGGVAHFFKLDSLFRLKNNLHPIALAVECIVTGIYWPLRIMFIHILVKDPNAKFIPLSVDLCLHLVPVLGLAIDYFFFMPKWTVLPRFSLGACVVLAGLYWWWLKIIIDFENGGEYPYMFLNVPDELTRVLIFGVVALLAFALFMTLRLMHDLLICADITEDEKLKKEK